MATASDYTNDVLEFLNGKADSMKVNKKFKTRPGRKYDLVLCTDRDGECGYAFLFVERETGGIYKTASIKKPAEIERFNIATPEGRAKFTKVATPKTAAWLYLR